MRHFVVLGFRSVSKSEQGELVHLGGDRGEAITITTSASGSFVRKEMFELDIPNRSRHFPPQDNQKALVFTDVPGHDELVESGIDSFEKLSEVMQNEDWFEDVKGIGEATAVRVSEFLAA